jgi:hypothetical protein
MRHFIFMTQRSKNGNRFLPKIYTQLSYGKKMGQMVAKGANRPSFGSPAGGRRRCAAKKSVQTKKQRDFAAHPLFR